MKRPIADSSGLLWMTDMVSFLEFYTPCEGRNMLVLGKGNCLYFVLFVHPSKLFGIIVFLILT